MGSCRNSSEIDRHVRLCAVGRTDPDPHPWARPARRKTCLLRLAGQRILVRFGTESAESAPGIWWPSKPQRTDLAIAPQLHSGALLNLRGYFQAATWVPWYCFLVAAR